MLDGNQGIRFEDLSRKSVAVTGQSLRLERRVVANEQLLHDATSLLGRMDVREASLRAEFSDVYLPIKDGVDKEKCFVQYLIGLLLNAHDLSLKKLKNTSKSPYTTGGISTTDHTNGTEAF